MDNNIQRDMCVDMNERSGAGHRGAPSEAAVTGQGAYAIGQEARAIENDRRLGQPDRRRLSRGGRRVGDVARAGLVLGLISLLTSSTAWAQTRDLLIPMGSDTAWHGVYLPYSTTIASADITTFEGQAGKKIGALLIYVGWYTNVWTDIQRQLNVVDPMGIKLMVKWEPNLPGGGDPLAAILNGSQNAVIDDFAQQSKAWGKPFFLSFGHEMNGNWYAWSGAQTGNNPQKYIDAYRYVWNRFNAAGNTNAIWVWAPNVDSVPNQTWNNLNNYYPGASYVDWVAVDFYGLKWGDQEAGNAIDKVYTTYGLSKPIMIGETAAADCNNYAAGITMTKDQWIADLFLQMSKRPNLRSFFWFNINKEADWRITSCDAPLSQNNYQAGVASTKYATRDSTSGLPTVPAAPSNLTGSAGNAQASLSWSAVSGATSYNVEYSTTSGGPYQTIATGVAGSSYTHTGLNNGVSYYYVVTAQNTAGQSGLSNQASVTPVAPAPAPAPSGPISIWWPTPGAVVSGTEPFKALLNGYSLSSYTMYWKVGGDHLNAMYNSYVDAPHKEALVNFAGWTWLGRGPYTITFVAKDSKGRTIASMSTPIYVTQ